MPRRPSGIFYGVQINYPLQPDQEAVDRRIGENPNIYRAKWDQLSEFSSPLGKKFATENALSLERMGQSSAYGGNSSNIFRKMRSDSQLGVGLDIINPEPEPRESTETRSGSGKYSTTNRPREHPMWTRSQEKLRKEKFSQTPL